MNNNSMQSHPPSFQRDAVRLIGLRTHADLNDCYGLVQSKLAKDRFEVRVGGQSVNVKFVNLQFVGNKMVFNLEDMLPNQLGGAEDMRKKGLVLDKFMRAKYMSALYR
jgi:hypothetical protein